MSQTTNEFLMNSIINHLETTLLGVNHGNKAYARKGFYKFIPLDLAAFADQLRDAKILADDPIHFLEVGCGVGTKSITAFEMLRHHPNSTVTGIEISAQYLKIARRSIAVLKKAHQISKHPTLPLFRRADALAFDYSPYNVIYYYQPFYNGQLARKFEERMLSQVKKGTIILANLEAARDTYNLKCRFLRHGVYVRK